MATRYPMTSKLKNIDLSCKRKYYVYAMSYMLNISFLLLENGVISVAIWSEIRVTYNDEHMLLFYRFILPLLVPYVIIAAYVLHFIDSKLLYCLFAFFWLAHNLFFGMFLVIEGTTLNYLLL